MFIDVTIVLCSIVMYKFVSDECQIFEEANFSRMSWVGMLLIT